MSALYIPSLCSRYTTISTVGAKLPLDYPDLKSNTPYSDYCTGLIKALWLCHSWQSGRRFQKSRVRIQSSALETLRITYSELLGCNGQARICVCNLRHCIKGKQCQCITCENQILCFRSKQSSLFSFYTLPSGGNSKGAMVY